MTPTPRTALLATLTAAALTLASCSTTSETASGSGTDTDTDTGVTVVASTAIWADVARAVDSDATITAIVESSNVDPHSFEPSAADLATAAAADLAVANGGGYDKWFYDAVDHDKIVHALPLVDHDHDHDHDHEHEHDHEHDTVDGNEHIWYDTDTVAVVAEDIAAAVDGDASAIVAEMDTLSEKIGQLPALRVAQTETVGDYLIDDSPMTDATPDGYRQAQLNHADPSAADLAAFLELIDAGEIDLLLYNPQTQTDLTGQLRDAAENAGIPIVEIGETPPDGTGFLEYFHQIVEDLAAAAQ